MRILVINGPNLNMLGTRETNIYGNLTLNEINSKMIEAFPSFKFTFFQSNCEGDIIDEIQKASTYEGLIINPAAYTHYSIAIRDALMCINIPKVEVHLSDYTQRELFRQVSITRDACDETFYGEGLNSYIKACHFLGGSISE